MVLAASAERLSNFWRGLNSTVYVTLCESRVGSSSTVVEWNCWRRTVIFGVLAVVIMDGNTFGRNCFVWIFYRDYAFCGNFLHAPQEIESSAMHRCSSYFSDLWYVVMICFRFSGG